MKRIPFLFHQLLAVVLVVLHAGYVLAAPKVTVERAREFIEANFKLLKENEQNGFRIINNPALIKACIKQDNELNKSSSYIGAAPNSVMQCIINGSDLTKILKVPRYEKFIVGECKKENAKLPSFKIGSANEECIKERIFNTLISSYSNGADDPITRIIDYKFIEADKEGRNDLKILYYEVTRFKGPKYEIEDKGGKTVDYRLIHNNNTVKSIVSYHAHFDHFVKFQAGPTLVKDLTPESVNKEDLTQNTIPKKQVTASTQANLPPSRGFRFCHQE